MLFRITKEGLEPQAFGNLSVFGQLEKDLEDLLAENLFDTLFEGAPLMPVFQERKRQPEPDIVALDAEGNITIFELKLGTANTDALEQLFRYVDAIRKWGYADINSKLNEYRRKRKEEEVADLAMHHKDAFGLPQPLQPHLFNRHQRMIVVGSAADDELIGSITYWRSKGLDIDFMPYRVFTIGDQRYFEFFAKPYDKRTNPGDQKGVMFDTNRSYNVDSFADMVNNNKIAAYGAVKHYVSYLGKKDIVFYSHKGYGLVGAARITSTKPIPASPDELYHTVEFLTKKPQDLNNPVAMPFADVTTLLNKGFYWPRTIKHPYLSPAEANKLLSRLQELLGKP